MKVGPTEKAGNRIRARPPRRERLFEAPLL